MMDRSAAESLQIIETIHHPIVARALYARVMRDGRASSDADLLATVDAVGGLTAAATPPRQLTFADPVTAVHEAPVAWDTYIAAQAIIAHHVGSFTIVDASFLRKVPHWPHWHLVLGPAWSAREAALPERTRLERAALILLAGPIADAARIDTEDVAWSRAEYSADVNAARVLLHLAISEERERGDDGGAELDMLELATMARARALLSTSTMTGRVDALARWMVRRGSAQGNLIADLYADSSAPVNQRVTSFRRRERSGFLVSAAATA